MPLLTTKLHPPRLPSHLVERTRLLARLDSSREYKLTLLLAPVGFGKTTLVNQWLAARNISCAWLSLDAGDNDALCFWHAVMVSCQELLAHGAFRSQQDTLLQMINPYGTIPFPGGEEGGVTYSRALLEWLLRQRVEARTNVRFLYHQEVIDLAADAGGTRITGIRLRERGQMTSRHAL